MHLRPLGQSGLRVSPLCFGGNVFGWTVDERTAFTLLDAWVDAGFNFIDTANVYSRWVPGNTGGESETIIGKWLRHSGKRHRIVLATKVGKDEFEGRAGLHPRHIRHAVEASLKRLQTDCIDLYQSHDDDLEVPMEDSLGAYADLIAAGKVRAIGASNFSADRLQLTLTTSQQHGLPRYESLQPHYNLLDRAGFEDELQPLCVAEQVGVINYYALARGFLTGKYRRLGDTGKSPRGAAAAELYLNPHGLRTLAALDQVALRLSATPGQVALAWQMAQPGITAPIASATSLAQLRELVAVPQLALGDEDIGLLRQASAVTPG